VRLSAAMVVRRSAAKLSNARRCRITRHDSAQMKWPCHIEAKEDNSCETVRGDGRENVGGEAQQRAAMPHHAAR
jgi:hypothetical protein